MKNKVAAMRKLRTKSPVQLSSLSKGEFAYTFDMMERGDLKCTECGDRCKPARIRAGKAELRGWRCSKCGYEIISPRDVERAYHLLKAQEPSEVRISKRGNSFMVTIPAAIARSLGIDRSTLAEILLEADGRIAIRVKTGG